MEPRYGLKPVPLARRIRNAIAITGAFGSVAFLIASYQNANGLLREHWIYPAAVAGVGVLCAILTLMEKAWPERLEAAEDALPQGQADAGNGKDHTIPTRP